ncbi:hypothetical protein LES9216_00193 [Leuconostoc suionicum]|uniref:Uncharacterized protein n=1 Tax=Leuconostoc suionicum TaxID=1511761 RepID=A0A2N9K6S7_9LACO|nr:hypothetical protein LES8486_00046 [Leuconostoc suionicum]SPE06303.1 hypothetical protein LES9216_00193 [Leuconostoc suionicum]SPH02792.1 hypothetical protein LES8484_00046 [Leuconostoc suionicum]
MTLLIIAAVGLIGISLKKVLRFGQPVHVKNDR